MARDTFLVRYVTSRYFLFSKSTRDITSAVIFCLLRPDMVIYHVLEMRNFTDNRHKS